MNGDLSVTPKPTALDLAPSARRTPSVPNRSTTGHMAGPKPVNGDAERLAPAHGRPLEAARLKALLTDATMRVSTHHDEASDRVVLCVESRTTGEVVEQIPSEELLRLYTMLRQSLIDERA
jgi:hypothetical protein